jgi:hypothetical protein
LGSAAATRLARVRDILPDADANRKEVVVIDFGSAVDSREQRFEVPVELREETLFETNRVRRPGPLFTIVEEEIIKEVGTTTTLDADALATELTAHQLPGASARGLADVVRRRAAASFTSTHRMGATDYVVAFDRDRSRLAVVYSD